MKIIEPIDERSLCPMIVVAAGQGHRFGGERPKQYIELGGKPILYHTLAHLHGTPLIPYILPVIAPDGKELWEEWIGPHLSTLPKVLPPVLGGVERQDSVYLALKRLQSDSPEEGMNTPPEWIGIHDGVRPLVYPSLLARLLDARKESDALIAAIPAQDTVKQVNAEGAIEKTLDRSTLWLAQTPQIFRYRLIMDAHEQARRDHYTGTDDASLLERLGIQPKVVTGDARNLKITRPEERHLAEFLLQQEIS
ncbi:MAG: 2-C-methyl-D-erythritol 4-phosphate cytidylyltransferase [Magnetococcales bacterium]|nr:2-C-methyl-D-erythritol 4-phosphate cytidylyltransferase [Magnetococcales bacterium]